MDSNHRRRKSTDLQSVAFDRSATPPVVRDKESFSTLKTVLRVNNLIFRELSTPFYAFIKYYPLKIKIIRIFKVKKMENRKKKNENNGGVLLYGKHATISAIANPRRKINKILCTADNFAQVREVCRKNQREEGLIEISERRDIEKMLPPQAVHQGMAVLCSKLEDFSLEEICDALQDKTKATVMILDQVTDPQNVGTIIRSCVAFGCDALIMQDRNSPQETGAVAKAAVGMMEFLPIVRVTNLSRAIEKLKNCGFWVVGMDGYATQYIDSLDKNSKLAIVMGSEGKGMRRLVEETCDIAVKIPMSEKVESLNVATAASIILYELYR